MSVLSTQVDELRELATKFDGIQSGATRVVRVSLDMGSILREAADTICELHNRCTDLVDEREEYVWTREFMDRMAKHCGTKDCPSLVAYVEGLEAENAKLRELVEDMLSCIEIRVAFNRPPTEEIYETFAKQARELGVEVDE